MLRKDPNNMDARATRQSKADEKGLGVRQRLRGSLDNHRARHGVHPKPCGRIQALYGLDRYDEAVGDAEIPLAAHIHADTDSGRDRCDAEI